MENKSTNVLAKKIVKAFLSNKTISPLPSRLTKKISNANKFRKLCESKIKKPIAGFKAGGTSIPLLKKLKEKEPFYATVYKHNVKKNNKSVKLNKFILGIELEVCYLINKSIFAFKKPLNNKNILKFISHMAPCIEIVGYRQKKYTIKTLGDLCSDFGANVKFIIGPKKRFKNIKTNNLKTLLFNKKINHKVTGNTGTVYVNPLNSLKFVLKKIMKDRILINKDFYVFTGSTVGVVKILGNGIYQGTIDKLGGVSVKIY